jgi:hypothetical protein
VNDAAKPRAGATRATVADVEETDPSALQGLTQVDEIDNQAGYFADLDAHVGGGEVGDVPALL